MNNAITNTIVAIPKYPPQIVWKRKFLNSTIVTLLLISEIFNKRIRGVASFVAIVSLLIAYIILVFTSPIFAEKLGTYGPFYLYAGICFLGFILIKSKVKETRCQTLEQLEGVMVGH